MRNFTLKPLLFCTALAGMALQGTIKAQDITFRAAENEEAEASESIRAMEYQS